MPSLDTQKSTRKTAPFHIKHPLIHAAFTRWDRWTACGLPRADKHRCSSIGSRVNCVICLRIVGAPDNS